MQDLGPDIEDLLRRASEAYPLKQSEDKWDDIAAKLSDKSSGGLVVQKKWWQHKSLYTGLVLLFFVLIGLELDEYVKNPNSPAIPESCKF